MTKLARTIHKYETKVMVQIYMAGRQAVPTAVTGKRMVAPSPIGYSLHDQIPEEMTKEEIKNAVKKFGKAAKILKDSMIDGVEILAAGGYLINQFLSPYSNKREDEYGGSFENRTRFLREVIAEVRRTCGPRFPISVRFSADEFTEGGYSLEEGIRIAKACEEAGVDCLNVNNGNQECRYTIIEPVTFKPGWKSYITKAIKGAVNIPVISTNVIKKPEQAEHPTASGHPAESPRQHPQPEPGLRSATDGPESAAPVQTAASGTETVSASRISGTSLAALMSQARRGSVSEPAADDRPQSDSPVDPSSNEKLAENRSRILEYIRQERPRFYAFFEQMQFEGHVLRLAVPSEALREEILRNKLEILSHIAALAGINGSLELNITVNEEIRASRPIKLEDRMRYMTEKNPLLNELRKALDLEAE